MGLESLQGGKHASVDLPAGQSRVPCLQVASHRRIPLVPLICARDWQHGPVALLNASVVVNTLGGIISRRDFCLWTRHCRTPVPTQLRGVSVYGCRAKIIIRLQGNSASLVSARDDFLRSYVSPAKRELMVPGWVLRVRAVQDLGP